MRRGSNHILLEKDSQGKERNEQVHTSEFNAEVNHQILSSDSKGIKMYTNVQ